MQKQQAVDARAERAKNVSKPRPIERRKTHVWTELGLQMHYSAIPNEITHFVK